MMKTIDDGRHFLLTLTLAGCCVAAAAGPAAAQVLPPANRFQMSLDWSRFRGEDDQHEQVEVYYSFPQRSLTFLKDSSSYSGGIRMSYSLRTSATDSVIGGDKWIVPVVITDTTAAGVSLDLVGKYDLSLTAGDYILRLSARDMHDTTRADSLATLIPVRPLATDKLRISDIELASMVRQDTTSPGVNKSAFRKNTLEVVPNANRLFGEAHPCFYYAEAYNLKSRGDQADFVVRVSVRDAIGKEVIGRERPWKRAVESMVLVDRISVNQLRTGTYTLRLSLVDSSNTAWDSTSKKFYVYNSRLGVDSTLLSGAAGLPMPVFASMSDAELDREISYARYEETSVEKDQYRQLVGAEAKRRFLSSFWRSRGPTVRDTYLARVAYANNSFRRMGMEGYKTDRGRVYITYGPPDEIDRHPYEADMKPYEIWQYNGIQGGVIFVFLLRGMTGEYELVHSTHRDELHNPNWQTEGLNNTGVTPQNGM